MEQGLQHDPTNTSPYSRTVATNSFAKRPGNQPLDLDLQSENADEIRILVHVHLANSTNG
jgi:hypothetical protein